MNKFEVGMKVRTKRYDARRIDTGVVVRIIYRVDNNYTYLVKLDYADEVIHEYREDELELNEYIGRI